MAQVKTPFFSFYLLQLVVGLSHLVFFTGRLVGPTGSQLVDLLINFKATLHFHWSQAIRLTHHSLWSQDPQGRCGQLVAALWSVSTAFPRSEMSLYLGVHWERTYVLAQCQYKVKKKKSFTIIKLKLACYTVAYLKKMQLVIQDLLVVIYLSTSKLVN